MKIRGTDFIMYPVADLARAAKFNFDLAAIYADAKSREKTSGLTLVTPRKRRKLQWLADWSKTR